MLTDLIYSFTNSQHYPLTPEQEALKLISQSMFARKFGLVSNELLHKIAKVYPGMDLAVTVEGYPSNYMRMGKMTAQDIISGKRTK